MYYQYISDLRDALITAMPTVPDIRIGDYQLLPIESYPAICLRMDNISCQLAPPRAEITMDISILLYSITDDRQDSAEQVSDLLWADDDGGLIPAILRMRIDNHITGIGDVRIQLRQDAGGRLVTEATIPITARTWRTI